MLQWKRPIAGALVALATMLCIPSAAEDIDLFVGVDQSNSSASNVLFVLDTSANWGSNADDKRCNISDTGVVLTNGSGLTKDFTYLDKTSAGIQQCAMYAALKDINISSGSSIRIGVMGFNGSSLPTYNPVNDTTSTTACPNGTGGCLLMPLTTLDATTKPRILNWIRQLSNSNSKGNNVKTNNTANGATMQESWAYYTGNTGVSGRSYASSGTQLNTCGGGNYVIFVGDAYGITSKPGDMTNSANSAREPFLGTSSTADKNADPVALPSEKATLTGSVTTSCPRKSNTKPSDKILSLSGLQDKDGLYAINWATYMRRQSIKSYAVGITGPDCQPDYPGHLKTLAEKGGGKYFESDNFADLKVAFSTILDEIMAVNGVFASASLPVSVNTQGTYLNQVFVGMFRPQPDKTPRWMGNIKQYKFKAIQSGGTYDLKLVGADDVDAINTNTGFITQCARSFWGPATKPTTDYWSYPGSTLGTCTTVDATGQSDFPDGDVVEKGAAGYRLRMGGMVPASRVVKTCTGTCTSLTDFDTTSSGLSSNVVNWVRGQDTLDENTNTTTSEVRPSVHGDVVHSRPVAVDYGGTTGVVVFYGANDGMLRAINGNQTGTGAGDELWAFVAPEHFSRFDRIYNNTTKIDFPSQNDPAKQKPYFFDGPVSAYQNGSTAWIFATQRRGGRMIYAFDVSTPASPTIKWRAGCTGSTDASCTSTTDFSGIGQTWSAPRVIRTQTTGTTTPLVIFGGGYDACEDTDNGTTNNSCTAPKGNQVYVLNADTGAVVKTFSTLRSVVGDVTIVRNAAGLAEYGYTADTGGNVYRIKLTGASASTDWSITRIAALGRDTVPASSADGNSARKFMYGPEVVVVSSRGYNAVLLGSGDREHPLPTHTATAAVQNYFYMLMDKPTDASWLSAESTACGSALLCHASLLNIVGTSTATVAKDLEGKKGWKMQLRAKEQTVTSAVVLFGTVTFSTHQPLVEGAESCSNSLGTARVYNVSYLNAAPPTGTTERSKKISGGGLPPAPVAGMVTVPKPGGGEMTVAFIIGSGDGSPLEPETPKSGSSSSTNKERIYWYTQK